MFPPTPAGARRPGQVRLLIALALPLLIAVAIAGCGDQAGAPAAPTSAPQVMVHSTATVAPGQKVPDPKEGAEDTAYAPGVTPQFLVNLKDSTKDKTIARYAFAVSHAADLSKIPCYCGCALYQHAHTSLQSCYMRSIGADGTIVYTDHSTSCDICTGEVDLMMQVAPNTPLTAIRQAIHQKFGYTNVWTDTPPIE
ncbi:MAG TPA: PCYCGC motif-containing (lipo)protein [Chloroflexia bacterium]|jgi:hypothetical protein|nr:PCYCGC motif-containing (lipo)protein [Chloroflexia bacterium]